MSGQTASLRMEGVQGGEALDNCNPEETNNSPDNTIDQPKWGTRQCCYGAQSGSLACVPPEELFHVPLSQWNACLVGSRCCSSCSVVGIILKVAT
jgi:hypothetical protein